MSHSQQRSYWKELMIRWGWITLIAVVVLSVAALFTREFEITATELVFVGLLFIREWLTVSELYNTEES